MTTYREDIAEHQQSPRAGDLTSSAAIVGEVSARLIEIMDTEGALFLHRWLGVVHRLNSRSPKACRLLLQLQAGSLGPLSASWSDAGAQSGRSKQAEAQAFDDSLAHIRAIDTRSAEAIESLRKSLKGNLK
jgi:hypothetical protein